MTHGRNEGGATNKDVADRQTPKRPRLSHSAVLALLTGLGVPTGCATFNPQNGSEIPMEPNSRPWQEPESIQPITVRDVREGIYGPHDPTSRRPEALANSASGQALIRSEHVPEGILAPLGEQRPGDPPATEVQQHAENASALPSIHRIEYRLHEGGRSFTEMISEADADPNRVFTFSCRLAQAYGEDGNQERFFVNWRNCTLEPTNSPAGDEANQRFEHLQFSYTQETNRPQILDEQIFHGLLGMVLRSPIGRNAGYGRLPGAMQPCSIRAHEIHGVLRGLRFATVQDRSGGIEFVVEADVRR